MYVKWAGKWHIDKPYHYYTTVCGLWYGNYYFQRKYKRKTIKKKDRCKRCFRGKK